MQKHTPLVSIITPSFNSTAFIERTIRSVLVQDYPNVEHIVVDGASTDGTLDILQRYSGLRWISEPDSGQSDALNKGLRMAQGEIVGWLNSDDTYNPGAITEAVNYLVKHPETAMVYSDCYVIDERDNIVLRQVTSDFNLGRELIHHLLPQPTVFMRKSAIQKVGGLDPTLHYVMDYDLFLRMGRHFPIKRIEATWANFRECRGTKTSNHPERFWPEIIRVFDRFFSDPELPLELLNLRPLAYGNAHWMASLLFFAKGQRDLGRYHLFQAMENGHGNRLSAELLRQNIVGAGLKVGLAQPESFHARRYIKTVLHEISPLFPDIPLEHRQLLSRVEIEIGYPLYIWGDRKNALYYILRSTIVDPSWFRNKGIMAVLLELLFGTKSVKIARLLKTKLLE